MNKKQTNQTISNYRFITNRDSPERLNSIKYLYLGRNDFSNKKIINFLKLNGTLGNSFICSIKNSTFYLYIFTQKNGE